MSSRSRAIEQRHRRQHQRAALWVVVGIVVVIAAVAAVVASNGGGSASKRKETAPVQVQGEALPAYDSSAPDTAIGLTIPAVTGTNFDGTPVAITNDGKAKVLMFVAHWCPHCQREVPLLAPDLRAHPLPSGVEMVTVSTSVNASAPNYPPSKWLAGVQWPEPVLRDDGKGTAANAFGLQSFPYFVFVDAHNRVVSRTSGEIPLSTFHEAVNAIAPH